LVPIGRYSTLTVVSITDFGVYLDGQEHGKILLPGNSVPRGTEIGHELEVFVYFDSEERIIATTSHPRGEVGDFVLLRCTATTEVGSFVDWGLARELFVPFREQKVRLVPGEWYVVRIYVDDRTGRLAGSTKLQQFLDKSPDAFEPNQEVSLLILYRMDLGYVALIDQRYQGMLYHTDVFRPLRKGDRCRGWIRNIRDDGKIDLALQPRGVLAIDEGAEQILTYLREHGGSMELTDQSPPEDIRDAFGMSKKQFKRALGSLFRQEKITMSWAKVTLLPPKP